MCAKFQSCCNVLPHMFLMLQNGTRYWPGLGGSDTDYALVLVSYPLFEVLSTPLAGALLHRLPYSVSIASFTLILVAGGILYGLARSVWMAFVGFGLFGMGAALCSVMIHTYMGEVGTVMDEIRKKQGKKPRKFVLYIIYSFPLNGGFILPFGKFALVSHSHSFFVVIRTPQLLTL